MAEKFVTFVQNPKIDILFGYRDLKIPSKREDFKPINVIGIDEEGKEHILEHFYEKKPSSKSVFEFESLVRERILSAYSQHKFLAPSVVEVVIIIYVTQKHFFDVDVDNISKTILDCIKGYIFEDDSQVSTLICRKEVHPQNVNGFFIAITEITDERKGILGEVKLYSEQNPT